MEKLEQALPEGMSVSKLTEVLKTAGYDLVPTEGGEPPEEDDAPPFGSEEGPPEKDDASEEGEEKPKDEEKDEESERKYPKGSDGDRLQMLKKFV